MITPMAFSLRVTVLHKVEASVNTARLLSLVTSRWSLNALAIRYQSQKFRTRMDIQVTCSKAKKMHQVFFGYAIFWLILQNLQQATLWHMSGDTTTRIPYELQNVPNILHDLFVHKGRSGDIKKWEILQTRSRVLDLVRVPISSQVMWQI